MAKIVVTLKRSPIGRPEDQKRTVRALGLRKLHQSVVHDDTPSIRGMIAKVAHLVEVRPAEAATAEAAKGGQSR
ncbi:50S ribosomal protein L30 [Hydrogenibacillus schlegelii]|uniref:Large ribosomal subunit protein uL30 n=1 Tax=Hydrogenibacillus schlegelii TaxID=1484 RepID=A0A132N380_HYDSH|nr:50S ribosomal protein L30 [Hydrogenibacillus schlegelii]KWX04605.1 50S ribosomal protein L30 [Hydrogenibacillus schlegelii]OAR04437.1 50S ribosomal protein L30 [Hydrogenibacillus schlegelii]PTQ52839.1 MAG: LSU ribosomal protein L30p (L7e) [Hydrogenibacillus schlegelii]